VHLILIISSATWWHRHCEHGIGVRGPSHQISKQQCVCVQPWSCYQGQSWCDRGQCVHFSALFSITT